MQDATHTQSAALRCPGLVTLSGALAGICVACERLYGSGPAHMPPAAKWVGEGAARAMYCPNRRATGA